MKETNAHNHPDPVPFLTHESICVRLERTIGRLWILSIVEFAVLVISTAAWHYTKG